MSLIVPKIEPGDILTEDMTTNYISDANDELTNLTGANIAPYAVQRYHLDVADDGALLGYKFKYQSTTTGIYNNTTAQIISHGGQTSEVEWVTPLPIEVGYVIRAQISCMVDDIIVSSTATDISDDMYYLNFECEDSLGTTFYTDVFWGNSMSIRNSGGTLTTDTPIDTKAFDVLNILKYRHVDITQCFVVRDTTLAIVTDIKKLRWVLKIGNGNHDVKIKEFSVSFFVYKG